MDAKWYERENHDLRERVAAAAANFIASITSLQSYSGGKWQANGTDETLAQLYDAVKAWERGPVKR